jgi:hypothetical protein
MAAQFVCRAFFSNVNVHGISAGWSETYYLIADTYTTAQNVAGNLILKRLALSCGDMTCDYAYVSDVEVRGDSLAVFAVIQPGTFGTVGDTSAPPEMALHVRQEAGPLYHITRPLHCLPSGLMVGPDFIPNTPWNTAFTAWVTLVTGVQCLRVKDKVTHLIIFPAIDGMRNLGIIRSHRVGRPFGQYRGRRVAS